MTELPEALTMARQMTRELQGQRIESCIRGNAPPQYLGGAVYFCPHCQV